MMLVLGVRCVGSNTFYGCQGPGAQLSIITVWQTLVFRVFILIVCGTTEPRYWHAYTRESHAKTIVDYAHVARVPGRVSCDRIRLFA